MRVLVAGLDQTTVAFLRLHGINAEEQGIKDAVELSEWLVDGLYEAGVIDLTRSNLGIYAPRELRNKKLATPLIGISVPDGDRPWPEHRALFLENGGDDLLRGPTNPRELAATLHAVTRRLRGSVMDVFESVRGKAHLRINMVTLSVTINGMAPEPRITGSELQLLFALARGPGRVMSKEGLLNTLYGHKADEPEMKIIDVFVCKLRKKFASVHPEAEGFIETIWGRGYRLQDSTTQQLKEHAA